MCVSCNHCSQTQFDPFTFSCFSYSSLCAFLLYYIVCYSPRKFVCLLKSVSSFNSLIAHCFYYCHWSKYQTDSKRPLSLTLYALSLSLLLSVIRLRQLVPCLGESQCFFCVCLKYNISTCEKGGTR